LNILVFGLMQHRNHVDEAELLLRGTRMLGNPVPLATWNVMLKGYAKLGDDDGVLSVLHRIEAAGYRPDRYTEAALASLREKKGRLLDRLGGGRGAKEGNGRGSSIIIGPRRDANAAIDALKMQKLKGERRLRFTGERDRPRRETTATGGGDGEPVLQGEEAFAADGGVDGER
jgi:pentatricopeptide repeat protein